MKTYRSLLIFLLILTAACNKEQIQKQQPVTANDAENAVTVTKTQILTARPWRYQKLVYNFIPKTKKGKTVYTRGSSANMYNLDNVRASYATSGAYDEIDSVGTHHPGTWIFTSAAQDSVKIMYTGNPTPLTYAIQTLSAQQYSVVYRVGNTLRLAAFTRVPPGK